MTDGPPGAGQVKPARRAPPPPLALLLAFLARSVGAEEARPWVLRGSLATRAYHPGSRAPMDLDYLALDPPFDEERLARGVRRVLAREAPGSRFDLATFQGTRIWADTPFPGLRVQVRGHLEGLGEHELRIDFGYGDPMVQPPVPVVLEGVGPVPAVARETLIAWKIHGIVEFGRGRWRAKDLADLHLLLSEPTDDGALLAGLSLAFSSRGTELQALCDLLGRPSWGQSRGAQRRWRSHAAGQGDIPTLEEAKARLISLLSRLGVAERVLGQGRDILPSS